MTSKAFVLLSGGLDSTTALFQAIYDYNYQGLDSEDLKQTLLDQTDYLREGFDRHISRSSRCEIDWVEAVSIDYGQRHAKEMEYAARTCAALGIEHNVLKAPDLLVGPGVMLGDASVEIPNVSYEQIQGVSPTYVPFRNGTMLSILSAHAQKWVNQENEDNKVREQALANCGDPTVRRSIARDIQKVNAGIYFGAHAEDAHNWAYPDCTPEFIGAMANAIYIGTYHQVRLHTPLMWLRKSDIVVLGDKLGVPFKNTWSCYAGEELHCGTCPTCRSRKDAFRLANVKDPTEYAA